jgi:hypothetical protein
MGTFSAKSVGNGQLKIYLGLLVPDCTYVKLEMGTVYIGPCPIPTVE